MGNAVCSVRNYFLRKLYEIFIHSVTPRLRADLGSMNLGKTPQVTAPGMRRL